MIGRPTVQVLLNSTIAKAQESRLSWAHDMNAMEIVRASQDPESNFPAQEWRHLAQFVAQVDGAQIPHFMSAYRAARQTRLSNNGLAALPHQETGSRDQLAEFYIEFSELDEVSVERFMRFLIFHRDRSMSNIDAEKNYLALCDRAKDIFYTTMSPYLKSVQAALEYLADNELAVDEALDGVNARLLKFILKNAREIESYGTYIYDGVHVYEQTDRRVVIVITDKPQDLHTHGELNGFIVKKRADGFQIMISLRHNVSSTFLETALGRFQVHNEQ